MLQFRADASVGARGWASPLQQPVSELMSGPVGIMLRPPGSPERPDYIASSGQARAKEIPSASKLPLRVFGKTPWGREGGCKNEWPGQHRDRDMMLKLDTVTSCTGPNPGRSSR